MPLTNAYLDTTKNLGSVIESISNARVPVRFTGGFLKKLGFENGSDRRYIGLFKALGLLDKSGRPTQRYFECIDRQKTGRILARGMEEAYEDLFNLRKDAQNLSKEELKNKLKILTQGRKSERVLRAMSSTFKALSILADWDDLKEDTLASLVGAREQMRKGGLKAYRGNLKKSTWTKPHCSVQIHLPESTNRAVYDAIFENLRKHLI